MDREKLRGLSRPRTFPWLIRVLMDWSFIIAAIAVAYQALQWNNPLRWPVVLGAVIVIGARQHGLGILGHDGAHQLTCRNRRLNDLLSCTLCLWPLGFPLEGYRRFHFKHHRTAGTPGDPELLHKSHRWLGQWKLPLRPWRVAGHLSGDIFGGGLPHLGMAATLTRAATVRDQVGPALFIGSFLLVSWLLGQMWLPVLWFGSLLTAFWVAFRLRIWTEHTVEDAEGDPTHRISATWWQRFLFLPHNTWCHWEHHLHPNVPAWNLPRLRELTLTEGPPVLSLADLYRRLSGDSSSWESQHRKAREPLGLIAGGPRARPMEPGTADMGLSDREP